MADEVLFPLLLRSPVSGNVKGLMFSCKLGINVKSSQKHNLQNKLSLNLEIPVMLKSA
jgi:hypothetical protein